jgi:hypothetical protein
VVDLCQDADLVVCELTQFRSLLEFVDVHHFDRVEVLGFSVLGAVYVTVLAFSDALHQYVIFNNFVHHL